MTDDKCPVCGKGQYQEHSYRAVSHLDCVRELSDRLAKCSQQKYGLASAAKRGMAAVERAEQAESEHHRLRTCLEVTEECRNEWRERAQKTEVEVAALKAQRCDNCRWREAGAMDPDSCEVLQGFIPCKDFGCTEWTARP